MVTRGAEATPARELRPHVQHLEPDAHNINLAKSTLGKCSSLIMTDLEVGSLDITLLDIIFSFRAQGKLLLHRGGHVAGGGTA